MAKVEFLGPIGREPIDVNIDSLQDLKEYFKNDEKVQEWLDICAVAVNDRIVSSLEVKICKDDRISLLPPVCGG